MNHFLFNQYLNQILNKGQAEQEEPNLENVLEFILKKHSKSNYHNFQLLKSIELSYLL